MSRSTEPLFLARQSYRHRRFGDAARFLPLLGVILLLLPVLWSSDATTRGGLLYVFSVWAILIALVWPISARLKERVRDAEDETFAPSTSENIGDGGA